MHVFTFLYNSKFPINLHDIIPQIVIFITGTYTNVFILMIDEIEQTKLKVLVLFDTREKEKLSFVGAIITGRRYWNNIRIGQNFAYDRINDKS